MPADATSGADQDNGEPIGPADRDQTGAAHTTRPMRAVAISAHRGGGERSPAGTYAAYQAALNAGADFLEFDVRSTADGELVALHPARLARRGPAVRVLSYTELCDLAGFVVPTTNGILEILDGRAGAHVDLKEPDCLAAIATQLLGLVAPEQAIVTTGDFQAVRSLRERYPALRAGLTIGGDVWQRAAYRAWRAGVRARSPVDAIVASGATWAVVHARLAGAGALADCRRRGLRTMVWTVNSDASLARWLGCPDADVVVTDRPERAIVMRGTRC
jgi:glycerophosphoryl diester phosphodiesterase